MTLKNKLISQNQFLLFIDPNPVDEELKDYFAKFNLAIVQQNNLNPIPSKEILPSAILINWSIIQIEPELIQQFYNNYPVPIIVINDTPDEETRILMLESRADDCVTKPLYPRELHARISAINRRVMRSQQKEEHEKIVFFFSQWHFTLHQDKFLMNKIKNYN